MSDKDPAEIMARKLARDVADSLPLKPEWFANVKNDLGEGIKWGKDENAEQAFRSECEQVIYDELYPMLALVGAGAAARPAVTAPDPEAQPQGQELRPGKAGYSQAVTGCRRGYLHRPGFTCPVCGDTGEALAN